MKRLILSLLILVLCVSETAFAMEVYLPLEYIVDRRHVTGEDGRNYTTRVYDTGKEYLRIDYIYDKGVDLFRSSDWENWKYIKSISSDIMHKYENGLYMFPVGNTDGLAPVQIENTGNEYLVRYKGFDNIMPANDYVPPSSKIIAVYDLNFNYVRSIDFDGTSYIVKMSYIDNICYVTLANSKTYKSADLVKWEEIYDGIGIPISNGEATIFTTHIKKENTPYSGDQLFYQSPILTNNNQPDKYVAVEMIDMRTTDVYGSFFVTYDNRNDEKFNAFDNSTIEKMWQSEKNKGKKFPSKISFSKDGVYWATLTLPEEAGKAISWIEADKDGLLICYDEWRRCKLKYRDMESVVPKSDTYIEVNGEILGFDTPPFLENDRLLVPMRFLFSKLGAQVDWNNESQTATVSKDNQNVSFSIGNKVAQVNGKSKNMDVPPRLINDRTMVPIRFLSEELGYTVEWDGNKNLVTIRME